MNVRPFLAAILLSLLAACASAPTPQMQRAERLPSGDTGGIRADGSPDTLGNEGPRPVIRRGSAAPINQAAASAPHCRRGGQIPDPHRQGHGWPAH